MAKSKKRDKKRSKDDKDLEKQRKKQAKADASARKKDARKNDAGKNDPGRKGADPVAELTLALRDSEAKLVAAEHRLHQVQQQLDDATGPAAQEAVVDAAVAETVAEALDAALSGAAIDDLPQGSARATGGAPDGGGLTPPLPHEGSEDRPNASWTLVRLRKEADRRGITGVSNLTKATLVERLNA